MSNDGFVCPDCGERNATESGPCGKCGSRVFRGDRDRPDTKGETYQKVADTVGLVPSVRWKDNLYQGIAVAATSLLGVIGGAIASPTKESVLAGLLIGLVVGFILSGLVLMVVGWVRVARGRR